MNTSTDISVAEPLRRRHGTTGSNPAYRPREAV